MAGTNGPTSAAGTNDTKHPDAPPDAAGAKSGGKEAERGGEVETPTPKPGDAPTGSADG